MRALGLLVSILVGLGLCTGTALAEATGKALGVDPDARAETKSGIKQLTVGTDVFIGDRVVTDARGLVQIRFSDSTRLVVGPNSSLVLEDYLLRDDGSGGKLAVNALSGTFRFITGGAPKDRYLIQTPTGTIGVRGTALELRGDGSQFSAIVLHGSIIICNRANQCVTLDDVCDIGMVNLSEATIVGNSREMTQGERDQMRAMFPWVASDGRLLGPFRVVEARECFNRPVVNNTPGSLGAEGSDAPPRENSGFTNGNSTSPNP